MGERTAIEWADRTWSPWEGCTEVSNGPSGACANCYAKRMNVWLHKGENWGAGAPRRVFGSDHWDKPRKWNERAAKDGTRPSVFPSICDPFDNEVAPVITQAFYKLVEETPHLRWLLLTKRVGNVAKMVPPHWLQSWPKHARIGATVVTQDEADRDIDKLIALPCPNMLSIEPMMSALDLGRWLWTCCGNMLPGNDHGELGQEPERCCGRPEPRDVLDWVIAGGESGPRARPSDPDWFRSLRDQCAAAGVPFFFKQWGEHAPNWFNDEAGNKIAGTEWIDRMGKRYAGRLLDGVEHNGMPA